MFSSRRSPLRPTKHPRMRTLPKNSRSSALMRLRKPRITTRNMARLNNNSPKLTCNNKMRSKSWSRRRKSHRSASLLGAAVHLRNPLLPSPPLRQREHLVLRALLAARRPNQALPLLRRNVVDQPVRHLLPRKLQVAAGRAPSRRERRRQRHSSSSSRRKKSACARPRKLRSLSKSNRR